MSGAFFIDQISNMKITIIQTGEVPEPLRDRFGPYAPMFHNMFARIDAGFDFETTDITGEGTFPPVSDLEAIIITGSPAGVYDQTPWMQPLRDFIRAAYTARLPMVGICFGHQIMADALGGTVRKSEKGWGLGRHIYDVTTGSLATDYFGKNAAIAASHQDQVITPPPTAQTYLSTPFTPYAGLQYENGTAISMQPHPEFSPDYSKALCDLRLNNPLDQAAVAAAKQSLDAPLDNDVAARFFTDFLKKHAS